MENDLNKKIKTYLFTFLSFLISANCLLAQDYENYTYKLSQSTSGFEIWTTTPANKTLKTTAAPDETGSELKVYCAKNEFEPLVVIIKPASSSNITINIGDFGSNIQAQLNQVKYLNLTQATDNLGATGYFPDPLKPVEFGESISLPANENTAFWITVYVPSSADGATDYTANLTINGITIPVKLHVFDFEISETPHIKSQMNFSHETIINKYGVSGLADDYWMYVDKIKQYFIDHRLTPKSVLWSGGLTSKGAPYIDYDCSGTITDNDGIWGFDLPAERYLTGTGNMNSTFSAQFNNGNGFPSFMCATFVNNNPSSEQRPASFCGVDRGGDWSQAASAYNTKWFQFYASVQTYLESHNLLDKAYYYMANEPQDQTDYDSIAWYATELKKAAPNLKLMVSEEPKAGIYNNASYPGAKIDIWLPVLHQYDHAASWDRETNHKEESWIYFLHGTRPPYFNPITIDHQGVESKFTGWFLWKYRLKGIAYYSCNNWDSNPWTSPMSYEQNGNKFLLYPPSESNSNITYGSNNHRFVPSIRFELLRDGFEDYEYLYTLAGGQPAANTSNSADTQADKIITGLTSYNRDAEFMYNIRRLIGLKNGNEIATIPDITPPKGHWRTVGEPGKYYLNFQDPAGSPQTSFTQTIEGLDYKYYTLDNIDYLQVGTNNYDKGLGYGWYAPNDVNWMMKYDQWFENTNDLQKSYVYSDWARKATFEFDLPNGEYQVTASVGKRGSYSDHTIKVEDVQLFDHVSTNNNCVTNTITVQVADKKLTMEMGDGQEYTILNYLKIEGSGSSSTAVEDIAKDEKQIEIRPNPIDETSRIIFNLEKTSQVKISLLTIEGKEFEVFLNKKLPKGQHQIPIITKNKLKKGVYLCRFDANGQTITKKVFAR